MLFSPVVVDPLLPEWPLALMAAHPSAHKFVAEATTQSLCPKMCIVVCIDPLAAKL